MGLAPAEKKGNKIMKCTFVNKNNQEQTIEIPQEFIDRTRRSLGCDVREACQIYLSDEGYIENDYVEFLNAKANGGKKRKGPKRKEDPIKRALITYLYESIDGKAFPTAEGTLVCENAAIANPERIIQFTIGDDTYEITLSRKRKPKNV